MLRKVICLLTIFIFTFTEFTFTVYYDFLDLKKVLKKIPEESFQAENFAKVGYILSTTNKLLSEIKLDFSLKSAYADGQIVCYKPEGPTRSTPAYNPETGYCETWPLDEYNTCPERYIYSQWLKTCVDSPSCTQGYVYNSNTKQCEGVMPQQGSENPQPNPEMACAVDLNGDGEFQQEELAECVSTDDNSKMCPLDMSPCQAQYTQVSCPTGYTYDSTSKKCTKQPSCASGYTYDNNMNQCVGSTPDCPSGYTYNTNSNNCQANPTCVPGFTYNGAIKYCNASPTTTCGPGYTYNPTYNKCIAPAACNTANWSFNQAVGMCRSNYQTTNTYVIGLYNVVLSRVPDDSGYMYWAARFYSPPTYDQVLGFVNAAQTNYLYSGERMPCGRNLSAQACSRQYAEEITTAYVQWLGRCPEPGGWNYWCNQGAWQNAGANTGARFAAFQQASYSSGECGACPKTPSLAGCPCPNEYMNQVTKVCSITPTYDYNYCYFNASCPAGGTVQRVGGYWYCATDASKTCPPGSSYNASYDACIMTPSCASGGSWNQSIGMCVGSASCPAGGSVNGTIDKCVNSASCSSPGSLNVNTDMCEYSASCSDGSTPTEQGCFSGYACPYGNYPCKPVNGTLMCSAKECVTTSTVDTEDEPPTAYVDDGPRSPNGECLGQIYIFNGKKSRCRKAGWDTSWKDCCDDKLANEKVYDSTGSIGGVFSAIRYGGEVLYHAYKAVYLASWFAEGNTFLVASENTYMLYNTAKQAWWEIEKGSTTSIAVAKTMGEINPAQNIDPYTGNTITEAIPGGDAVSSLAAQKYLETIGPAITMAITHLAISGLVKDPKLAAVVNLAADAYFLKLGWISPYMFAAAVVMTILTFLMGGCNAEDILTVTKRKSKRCHYVGEYCQKEIPLIGCIQKAKSYCCFNSKLARIIHEQGRPQLSTDIHSWGSAKKPKCRGFTPEEFASLDFDQIDLSEYIEDITKNIEQNVNNLIQEYFNESIQVRTSR